MIRSYFFFEGLEAFSSSLRSLRVLFLVVCSWLVLRGQVLLSSGRELVVVGPAAWKEVLEFKN